MSTKYILLKITEKELLTISEVISSIEATIGCSDVENEGDIDFDNQANKAVLAFNKVIKRNGYKIN